MIEGYKQQAGMAPGGNRFALLMHELHSLWPGNKVALIWLTVGSRMLSLRSTSGSSELCVVGPVLCPYRQEMCYLRKSRGELRRVKTCHSARGREEKCPMECLKRRRS